MTTRSHLASRLSSTSTSSAGVLLALCFLLIGFATFLVISNSHNWPHLAYILLLTALQVYYATFYQVSLLGNKLTITRLFSPTIQYEAHEFVNFQQSRTRRNGMQIHFTDGRSFAFLPELKTTSWSIYSILPEVFIKHRTREIKLATSSGSVK